MEHNQQITETADFENKKKHDELSVLSKVIVNGDLTPLKPHELVTYYNNVCETNGLNPATKPFELLRFQGKTILYARKDATDQLRAVHGISIRIVAREKLDNDLYIVTAQAVNKNGRQDESIGAISLAGLKGDALANAVMKCETKSKRRVTLSIAGLGFLDESETSSIPGAKTFDFDPTTGEIIDRKELSATKTEPTINHACLDDIKKMASSLLEKYAEDDKLSALDIISELTSADKKEITKHLSSEALNWLKLISQKPITKEDYIRA